MLGVEMASTGEVACFGADKHEAFLKALLSTGFKIPQKNILVSVHESLQNEMVHPIWGLHEMGYSILATEATHAYLTSKQIPSTLVHYPNIQAEPNVATMLKDKSEPASPEIRCRPAGAIRFRLAGAGQIKIGNS